MNATFQTIIDDFSAAATKISTVAKAVTGNPITTEMEALVPGLAKIVASVSADSAILGALGAAAPAVESAYALMTALGGKPYDSANTDAASVALTEHFDQAQE